MISETQVQDIETKVDQPDFKDIQISEYKAAMAKLIGYFEQLFPLGNLGVNPSLEIKELSPEERTLVISATSGEWLVTKTFLIKDHGQDQVRHTSVVEGAE